MSKEWIKTVVYVAGMQGACVQPIADKVIQEAVEIMIRDETTPEIAVARAMDLYNAKKDSTFSQGLINWLIT